jgi:hypothetical protein
MRRASSFLEKAWKKRAGKNPNSFAVCRKATFAARSISGPGVKSNRRARVWFGLICQRTTVGAWAPGSLRVEVAWAFFFLRGYPQIYIFGIGVQEKFLDTLPIALGECKRLPLKKLCLSMAILGQFPPNLAFVIGILRPVRRTTALQRGPSTLPTDLQKGIAKRENKGYGGGDGCRPKRDRR